MDPARKSSWRTILRSIQRPFPACSTRWKRGGFITRRLSAHSRRSNLVELTEKGRQAYAVWQDCCGELEERMLRGFTQQEREAFAGYLSRAYQNLHAEKGEGHEGPQTTA